MGKGNPISIVPAGGKVVTGPTGAPWFTPISSNGAGTGTGLTPVTSLLPTQIMGLVDCFPCSYVDCRESPQIECYYNKVFGVSGMTVPSAENDFSTFWFDGAGQTVSFILQKNTNYYYNPTGGQAWQWNDLVTLNNNNNGILYPQGSIGGYPTYAGYSVNWGLVLANYGPGFYRIKINTCSTTYSQQATLFVPININQPLVGNTDSASGVIIIGGNSYPFSVTSMSYTYILNYIAAIINAGGKYTAIGTTSPSTGIIISGISGASANGTVVLLNQVKVGTLQGGGDPSTTCTCAEYSKDFQLFAWDCFEANGTVKFEMWKTGKMGDVNNKGFIFDITAFTMYDSIRMPGFFGYSNFTYDELMLEYGYNNSKLFGSMIRVHDKMVEAYKFNSNEIPLWLHRRFAAYALMSDTLLVSDANISNSNWFLNRTNVIKKGNYIPEYLDSKPFQLSYNSLQRRSKVSVEFLEGIQSTISNNC